MLVVNDAIFHGAFKAAPDCRSPRLLRVSAVGQRFPHCGLGFLSGWEIAASGPWTLSSIAHCLPQIIQLPVFPFFFFLNWGVVALQYGASFCCTMK